METAHVDNDRLADLVADHLSLHDDYLSGQLQSAERLTSLLERAADQGQLSEVLDAVNAVKEHGLDIGRSHLRANEILRDLASLELGAAPAAPAERTTLSRQSAPAARPAVAPAPTPAALAPAPAPAPAPISPAPAPEPALVSAAVAAPALCV